jgi:hypothetical protein
MSVLKVLIFVAIFTVVQCEVNKSLLKSIISHLEEEGFLDKTFSEELKDKTILEEKFNQTSIENLKKIFEKDVRSKMKQDDDVDCIMDNFRNYRILEFFLKGLTYSSVKKIKTVKNFAVESAITTRDLIAEMRKICFKTEVFGKKFEKMFNDNQRDIPKHNETVKKCLVKYYVEKGAFDAKQFGLKYEDAKNCDGIEKNLQETFDVEFEKTSNQTFYGLPSDSVNKCVNKRFDDEKSLLRITSFDLITKFKLEDAMIQKLKENFIEIEANQIKILFECLDELKNLKK